MEKATLSKQNKNLILIVVVAVVAVAVMLAVYYGVVRPRAHEGEKTVTLRIVYADDSVEHSDIVTKTNTVYELIAEQNQALELSAVITDTAYGKYLTSVAGTAENATEGHYYMVAVNDTYATVGIGELTFQDGDVIELRYIRYTTDFSSVELVGRG